MSVFGLTLRRRFFYVGREAWQKLGAEDQKNDASAAGF